MVDRFRPKPKKPEPQGRSSGPSPTGPDPRQRMTMWGWIVIALLAFLLLQTFLVPQREEIDLSVFINRIGNESVREVTITTGTIEGTIERDGAEQRVFAQIPPNYETNQITRLLERKNIAWTGQQESIWTSLLISLAPFLILGVLYYFFFVRRLRNQLGGQGPLSFGRNKAKLYDRTDMKTTFNDVAGVDEVEAELVELVDYLKAPKKFEQVGARIPKGVLLVGPPGTGKTLLARAVAGEAEVPFFYISASEFVELFVGLGAARVRDLFQQARQRAPAIVFIDEIDSIGQARSGAAGNQLGAHQEQEQTLQQLLTEMDGFEPNSGVIIVAASNRPEVLDQALLRPGRFDRQIVVNLPDIRGRDEILQIHARNVKLSSDVELKVLARRTPGFSGAQLANVINEGALLAARKNKQRVEMHDLEEAIDRVVAGLERRSQVLSDEERRLVAYHELGHAIVARFVDHADPVHRVSIIPRGIGALGYTQQLPDEERYLMSEPELRDRIAVLLGGRSAEEIVFGFATTGAQDDLQKATEIARRMVMEFGMSETVGPINIAEYGPRFLGSALRGGEVSSETEVAIDREVKSILVQGQEKARRILSRRRTDLDALAGILLDKESIGRRELDSYFGSDGHRAPAETEELAGPTDQLRTR